MKTYTQALMYCLLAFVSCQPAFGQVVNIRRDPLAIHRDGNDELTGDWDIGNGRMIQADKIRARDGDGLSLFEDGGLGIFIADGGVMTFSGPVVIPDDWELRMQTGGTRMVWDSTADPNTLTISKTNVGIGITPSSLFDVNGNARFRSQVRGPDGSAAIPAYSFWLGTNSGMFLGGSNTRLGLAVAANETVSITSTSLGINETAPAGDIEITNNDPNVIYHDTDETDTADELKGAWHVHGEKSGAEEYRAASIEVRKWGAADTGKAYILGAVNDGDDALSPTTVFTVDSNNFDMATSLYVNGTATSVLTGSIDPTASTSVTGVGTLFTTELVVGDRITVSAETRVVTVITNATSLTVDLAFTDTANDTSPDKLAAIYRGLDSSGNLKEILNDQGYKGYGVAYPKVPLQVAGVLKVGFNATGTRGLIGLGDDAAVTTNVGIFRGTAAGANAAGSTLILGGYQGVGITAANAALGSQGVPHLFVETDGDVTMVADLYVEDMIVDKTSTDVVLSPFKSVTKTLDFDDAGTTDFVCDDTAANSTAQAIDFGELIPAGCVIVSATLECDETVIGSVSSVVSIIVGTTTGANNLLAAADVDTDGDISSAGSGTWPQVATLATAQHIWVTLDPTGDWDALSAGKWSLDAVYYDRAAVRAQKGL